MVSGVRDEHPDVAQQGPGLEQLSCRADALAPLVVEAQHGDQFVEEPERQAGDLAAVLGVLVGQLHQVFDRLAAEVAQVVERGARPAARLVEQHALAQRVVGEDHLVDAEHLDELFEDDRSSEDDVGTLGVDAGQGGAGVGVGCGDEPVDRLAHLVGGDALAVVGPHAAVQITPLGDGHRDDRLDRAGRADDGVVAGALDLEGERGEHGLRVLAAPFDVLGLQRLVR